MQDRSDIQTVFWPTPQFGERIAIGAVSAASTQLVIGKEYHFFSTKLCWINIGAVGDTAAPWTIATLGDFPLSAGCIYRHTARSAADSYIHVIEDPSVAAITGYLLIGRAER